jgi:hypothetical protein
MNHIKTLFVCASLGCGALGATAQVLSDFSDFYSPDYTFFAGDWP